MIFLRSEVVIREVIVKIPMPWCIERLIVLPLLLYRRIRYGYAFRRIPLTLGKYTIVDLDDFKYLIKYKWHTQKGQRTYYALRKVYRGNNRGYKVIWMHRVIVKAPEDKFCDHINHNGLDNRKVNLRLATRSQNAWNRRKPRNKSKSKYKGITFQTGPKKWAAKIQVNGDMKFLGNFNDEIEAARAYDEAARKYYGEFAVLNFE